jgi:hypothetical protein
MAALEAVAQGSTGLASMVAGEVMTERSTVIIGVAAAIGCGGEGERPTSASESNSIGSLSGADSSLPSTGGTFETSYGDKLDLGPGQDLAHDTDAECVAQMLDADLHFKPVDVLVVVDTSNSMANAIMALEGSINGDFAAILEDSGLDYRVIVAADYPPAEQLSVCISMPLSGSDCNPPPAAPAVTMHYQHYDAATGSGAFLDNVVAWATTADPGGYMPGGYVTALRPEAVKTIMAMTDGSSASNDLDDGDACDAALLALPGNPFGSVGDRQYVFHLFTAMQANNPPSLPWGPADPLQGQGRSIQQLAVLTGGLRFPYTQVEDFDAVFQQIAMGVVEGTPIECSFAIPDAPEGETIDPDTIEIDYLPGGMGPAQAFHQVIGPEDCAADAFYIDGDMIFLCPEACAIVQADGTAGLDVRYGCETGFDPQG